MEQVEVEQRLVDAMYARVDTEIAAAVARRAELLAAPARSPHELYARDVEIERLSRISRDLGAAERALCFGRIDDTTGEALHVGRVGVRTGEGKVLLVDWRAKAARPFYAATPAAPLGLRRRRHLRLDGRRVAGVSDEILDGSAPRPGDVVGDDALVAALSRARTGRMREAAATLQAEQDAIVRSPDQGVVIVDGGPGTGKTIVALHRAAYVLYAFPAIAQRGVLVYGPNRRFLDYIADVLPSLGENDVRLATAADLTGTEISATDPDDAARRKGTAQQAEILARWVRDHQPGHVPLRIDETVLDARTVDDAHRHATRTGLAHNPAREAFKNYVVGEAVRLLEKRTEAELDELMDADLDQAVVEDLRKLGFDDSAAADRDEVDWDAVRENLLHDPAVDLAVDAVWPRLDAADAVPGARTEADLALLDEARALIDGPPAVTYGHIVVDEAQELSAMQWRMLMRRCPARSFTIVGDFAQAGPATTIRSWTEAVGERFTRHTLSVNYRTTAEILDAAAPVLARIDPGRRTSRSIRHGDHPRTVEVASAERVRDLVAAEQAAHPGELIAVIGAPGSVAGISVAEVRGLEFDCVFVVDPAAMPDRDLYVALTRATKRLVVVSIS